ncbi:MAG: efflux RND transporter periplasmic adaptor subunit [Planctomycetota bacterium]|jgi:multidrug efflux pump subunit AcrA (membrane-fusion protein)
MKYKKLIVLAVVLLVVVFVGSKIVSTSDSDHNHNEDRSHGHAHDGHGQQKSSQVTVWSDRFEVFLEHPFIVADKPTGFITHVTDRAALKPRRKGPVAFVLTDGLEKSRRHVEKAPARDGIYIPSLTFPQSGTWNVALNIAVDGKEHVVELPDFKVYKSQAEVDRAPFPEEVAGISFLKEQQWKIPFATELVKQQKTHSRDVLAIPESAIVDEGGRPVAFVQLAGETFEKRYLKLGEKEHGLIEVLSGLSEGEYVTTQGGYAVAEAEHEDRGGHQHGEHGSDSIVQLSEQDVEKFGIEVDRAGPREFEIHLSVPGEIVINTDRMAHIVPTVPGIVRQVSKKLGDAIKADEVIAWLESADLGRAKIDYLGKWAEVGCCALDLTRAEQIHDNTIKLLEILKTSPSLETLQNTKGIAMGDNRSKLISAYAEYSFAKAAYLREKPLFEQKITSEQDFLTAQNAFKKTDAQYTAVCDSIAFEVRRDLLEAQRSQQLQRMQLKGAERQLKLLSLTNKDIRELELLAQGQDLPPGQESDCTDPNCTTCASEGHTPDEAAADAIHAEEKLAWYPLRAPFDGTIISKHITLGEMVKDDSEVFVVADLSTVWVDLRVHQKDLALVKEDQKVRISTKSDVRETEGVIDYVSPVIDEKTRTALARIELDNTPGRLRPGTFITANVLVEERNAEVVVAKSVLQDVDDKTCVFVQDEHGFELRPVTIGLSNDEYVEIVAGLRPGEKIVTKNSFRLKAELEKAAGGGHAGHGHAH